MISLRFTRVGKKKSPLYRLIAVPKHRDPWGKNLEILGTFNPRTKEHALKAERIKHWLSVGAQPSNTVHNLLVSEGLLEGKKVSVTHISHKRRDKIAEKTKTETKTD
ncbi:TPA: 30S ribosomal protein S16 [Candidatus Uhrbacteria bacterium]|nr:30S ribosomal protein S16 [Candidatus Uhrbacteria bacterium]